MYKFGELFEISSETVGNEMGIGTLGFLWAPSNHNSKQKIPGSDKMPEIIVWWLFADSAIKKAARESQKVA